MEIDSPSDLQFFLKPAIRSYHFLAGTVLIGIDVAGGTLVLFKNLTRLSFGATACLTVGIFLLISSWGLALRQHERLSIFVAANQASLAERPVKVLVCAAADLIQRGLVLTSIAGMMLLVAIGLAFGH